MRNFTFTTISKALLITIFLLSSCGGGGGGSKKLSTDQCSLLDFNARIINGAACSEDDSPVVRISIQDNRGRIGQCTGTLISDQDVLTAAHCFIFIQPVTTSVLVDGVSIEASKVNVHPNVRGNLEVLALFNDVAVVRLSKKVSLKPVPLLVTKKPGKGENISIFGYGLNENGDLGTLRSGEMKISDVTDNHIAALFEGKGSNTCQGDSGGPAIIERDSKTLITGITSSGSEANCLSGDISLFTLLSNPEVSSFVRSKAPTADYR